MRFAWTCLLLGAGLLCGAVFVLGYLAFIAVAWPVGALASRARGGRGRVGRKLSEQERRIFLMGVGRSLF